MHLMFVRRELEVFGLNILSTDGPGTRYNF